MYSSVTMAIRCTFFMYDNNYDRKLSQKYGGDYIHTFRKAILYQPETGVTVMAHVPTDNYPSYHPHRRRRRRRSNMQRDSESSTAKPHPLSNYGYAKADDALTWFYRNALPLDERGSNLLLLGRKDNATGVTISVTIKYTLEFAATLGIRMDKAMYFVATWTIDVSTFGFRFR